VSTYEKDDYIKVEFPDETTGVSEWMWVRVDYADDTNRLVFGWLDSQPVVNAADLRLGQHLAVSYDNIRQHKKASEFDQQ
jgi:hypothetical protein